MSKPENSVATVSGIARLHGVSRNTVMRWRDQGVNLDDSVAVATRVAAMSRPEEIKAASYPNGESYSDAKRRRAVADADLAEMRARKESGELVGLAIVEQAFAEIGHVLRARLLALPSELVTQLEGLSGSQIHQVLKKRVHQLLHDLHQNNPVEKLAASSPTPDTATASHASRG